MMGNYKITHVIINQSLAQIPLPQMGKFIFSENGALKKLVTSSSVLAWTAYLQVSACELKRDASK